MKLKNTKSQAGLTLIEVTLVIAVLLGLVSVLFIGVNAYKAGSDRAQCIVTIATVQKAVRSYQNLNNLAETDEVLLGTIASSTNANAMIGAAPTCPARGTYSSADEVPATGTAYLTCSLSASDNHVPASTDGW